MLRLSKKGLILAIALITILLGSTGYLVWRTTQQDTLAPTDSDAAPPEDKDSCKGCRANGRGWDWIGGRCIDIPMDSCKLPNQKDPKENPNTACNGYSASSCQGRNPGTACGDDGECVNQENMGNSGYKCYCREKKPDPQPTTPAPNTCQGGAISTPAAGDTGKVDEAFVISGYAFDADGINKSTIKVSIDGVVVGNATAVDACPNGNSSVCTSVGSAKKPVVWTYSFTPTKESHAVAVSWSDSKGASGAACSKSVTLNSSPKVVTSANWSLSSTTTGISCSNTGGTNVSAVANYSVTVTNSGTSEGTLSRVEVVLDDAVEDSSIMTEGITPSATVSGGVITWNLSATAATFTAGQSKTYKFSLNIPKASYGVLSHEVSVVPSVLLPMLGDDGRIEQTLSSTIACTDDGKVPETAIFDSAAGQIAFSLVLISLGYLYLKGYDKGVLNILGSGTRKVSDAYIGVFGEEARVARSRKNFEKRMK